jgi:hypothetical protein
MSYSLILLSLDQPDEFRKPFFREQLRHKPYLYSSYNTNGSNTDHCLRERSQRLLVATHETTDCWEIPFSMNEIKYSFLGWHLIYVNWNIISSFQLVMRVLCLDNHLKCPSRPAKVHVNYMNIIFYMRPSSPMFHIHPYSSNTNPI